MRDNVIMDAVGVILLGLMCVAVLVTGFLNGEMRGAGGPHSRKEQPVLFWIYAVVWAIPAFGFIRAGVGML